MYITLKVGSRKRYVSGLNVGCSVTFDAYGCILGAAIKRCSKNRYKVSVIWTCNRVVIGSLYFSFREAMAFIQSCYNEENNSLNRSNSLM